MISNKIIKEHISIINALIEVTMRDIELFGSYCQKTIMLGNTIYLLGNGGSAADCQHLAAELVGRFKSQRGALPAVALTTDTSILTAISNDYGFEEIFARQVDALVRPGDLVVGISTSGNSPNVVRAIQLAKEKGARTVGLTGRHGGKLGNICDLCVKVPSDVTARIQEAHILIGHIVCEMVDEVADGV
ncbi:D-sedoheptulose 7-phosphate isomerase [Pelotomaculum isophthalicicum JI]|uniref:Phosphoheptose isomerase n=1 Tax=Pelotomaculum isophthalicicum JI TaxID=947010 RepID=A0A9X4JV34_9FIRM|nr:D-sedoheptulose 7-phosphate isomerase [Pelotomaculum isophthalicicum]MDF9406793.1 D-sedoheptulose 7-phosphate isomerase [Pelotomaculum isophthalicicum JI]